MTEQDRVREAVEIMTELFNLMTTPKLINVDSKVYDRRNSLGLLIDIATRYLSGELVDVAKVLCDGKLEEVLNEEIAEFLRDMGTEDEKRIIGYTATAIRSLFGVAK